MYSELVSKFLWIEFSPKTEFFPGPNSGKINALKTDYIAPEKELEIASFQLQYRGQF